MNHTSYDVRIWDTRRMTGARGTGYQVRWTVAKKQRAQTFGTRKLAESFRAGLLTASRKGEAFSIQSGLPVSLMPKNTGPTWLEFAMAFVDMKWPDSSPSHRRSTADGLVTITLAMVITDDEPPNAAGVRRALMHWAFNSTARKRHPQPPDEFAHEFAWAERNSRPLSDLSNPAVTRDVLTAIAQRLDGKPASPSTTNRKRAALSSAISYAIEKGHLSINPLKTVKVKRRKATDELDSRVVLNHKQAKSYLAAVRSLAPDLEALYGCIYYAAMRPSEVRNLRERDLSLPEKGWGEAILAGSFQVAGKGWTDDGEAVGERELKHRPIGATRTVPLPPQLVSLLREHLATFGTDADGRLFVFRVGPMGRPIAGGFGGPVSDAKVARVHHAARNAAFTETQRASPLVRRPYDLRHAAVSTWLAAGVPPTQAAAWAGHSVAVLLKVYAHAVDGQAEIARRRIESALADDMEADEGEIA